MHRMFRAAAAVALLMLPACSSVEQAGRIDYARLDSAYSRVDFAYAGSGRDMRTEIYGNPFPEVAQADFDEAVTSAMYGAHFGPATHFTTQPDNSARPAYRVRLLWNGPRSANGNNLCGDHDYQGGGKEPNGTARLIAAFCRSDRALSYLVGSVDGVTGPDDPKFVAFVRQATMRLFTPRDDRQERDRCFMPDC